MIPPFDEALAELLEKYVHHDPDELIAVLLGAVDGLKDQIKDAEAGQR